jgi:hypothetical protein
MRLRCCRKVKYGQRRNGEKGRGLSCGQPSLTMMEQAYHGKPMEAGSRAGNGRIRERAFSMAEVINRRESQKLRERFLRWGEAEMRTALTGDNDQPISGREIYLQTSRFFS